MNERIKELAIQARRETYDSFDDETFDWDVWHTVFQHKFAELIVAECAQSLWTEECNVSDLALEEFKKNSKKIRQHFGVEE